MKIPFIDKILSLFTKKVENVKVEIDGVLAREVRGAGKQNIDRLSIPLGMMCTRAKVYYTPEAINGYGMCINTWLEFFKPVRLKLLSPVKQLEVLVAALTHEKIVTQEDIYQLDRLVFEYEDFLDYHNNGLTIQYDVFQKGNADEDRVDWAYINIGTVDDKIPYIRIHRYFFKRRAINSAHPIENIKRCTHSLDRIISMMGSLQFDENQVGRGDTYELYRKRQRSLVDLASRLTDAIELECRMNEIFLELARTPLNVVVYPVTEMEAET